MPVPLFPLHSSPAAASAGLPPSCPLGAGPVQGWGDMVREFATRLERQPEVDVLSIGSPPVGLEKEKGGGGMRNRAKKRHIVPESLLALFQL